MTKKKKRKIEIPDAQEVARFGGERPAGDADHTSTGPDRDQELQTGQDGPQQATGSADQTDDLGRQVQELTEKHLRAVAELQNFRRRAATEKSEALRYATASLARSLFPVVDDLERSLAAAQDDASSLADGVKLVHKKLLKSLTDHHIERIHALGQPFDPQLHEAMMQEASNEHPPGTVLSEYEPGYKLGDRVLRHAKVVVSKPLQDEPTQAEPADEAAQ